MEFEPVWLLMALPVAFALGWLASRLDLRQFRRDERAAPRAYFKGLSLLLSEQQDKAIDAFIEAAQSDPDSVDLHFALGGLFRRRGEFERAVRVHEHLLARADLPASDRERARHALAQDFMRAGLFDRAEAAFHGLRGGTFDVEARVALLTLFERSRDWPRAIEMARGLEGAAVGSFASRVAHYECECAQEALSLGRGEQAQQALSRAHAAAPDLARPMVMLGEHLLRSGHPGQALDLWTTLRRRAADRFALVAADFARAAIESSQQPRARVELEAAYTDTADLRFLRALESLTADAQSAGDREQAPSNFTQRLNEHLRRQPSLSGAEDMLERPMCDWLPDTPILLRQAVQKAAAPLQRYRCAACGFEARQYFWQCPGCQGWDTFPARQLDAS